MREMNRAVHFDFHTMPGIHDFGRNFEADEFARALEAAHVDYINFFAHCNLGFAYYPTRVGIAYPQMRGDLLGEVLRACHARGIGVSAYVNVGLMHEQANLHPDWLRVDKEGCIYRGDRVYNHFFRTMCYNQPGYRAFLLALLTEVCALDVDGLFCDCMHFYPCHCPACTRDMRALGMDPASEEAARAFSKQVMYALSEQIRRIAGEKRVFFNGMPMHLFRDLNAHFELECLPSGGWGYDYLGAHAAYARNIYPEVLYMTGRFQAGWGDFGGYKGRASLENDVYDALINNLRPSVGDHLHPAENLEKDIYRDVGAIYARVKAYEPYTRGARFAADIGVLTDSEGPLGHEYAGLARMFGELKQSFEIVHVEMDFSRFRLLVLPDRLTVGEALAAKLRAWLDGGGALLSSGFAGLTPAGDGFALSAYAADFLGADASKDGYFSFACRPEDLADMRWATYAGGVRMRARRAQDVRAAAIKPYFDKHYDGLHGYIYTPPERETGEAAAVLAPGGRVAHIAFCVFEAYFDAALVAHKRLVAQLLDELLPAPLLRPLAGIPSTARAALSEPADGRGALLHVKATYPEPRGKLSVVEEHAVLPAGARIAVRGPHTAARVLPDGPALPVEREGEYAVVELNHIVGYEMIYLTQ